MGESPIRSRRCNRGVTFKDTMCQNSLRNWEEECYGDTKVRRPAFFYGITQSYGRWLV